MQVVRMVGSLYPYQIVLVPNPDTKTSHVIEFIAMKEKHKLQTGQTGVGPVPVVYEADWVGPELKPQKVIVVSGLYPASPQASGSKEEVEAFAKRLVEELGLSHAICSIFPDIWLRFTC